MEGVIAKNVSVWQQKIGEVKMQKSDLISEITAYLSGGGLFYPELANHVAVRDLLIKCREALAQPEPMRLRRGDILRSIETDELCTVWSTSTTGKTLIKWGDNDFCGYTAEQIGELFWLEPLPDDLELSAEKSDNYAAFHAGYRFAVAHSLAQPEQEPVAWPCLIAEADFSENTVILAMQCTDYKVSAGNHWLSNTPPQRKPLTDEEIINKCLDSGFERNSLGWSFTYGKLDYHLLKLARAIEAAHGIKENT